MRCYCGHPCPSKPFASAPPCSLHFGTLVLQKVYECHDCGIVNDRVCCERCAKQCHAGHSVRLVGTRVADCFCGRTCLERLLNASGSK
jgi:hypothetical protein